METDEYIGEEYSQVYSTDDLGLAAYLVLQEHTLDRKEWRPPGDCYFMFKFDDTLEADVTDYTGGLAKVDPKLYNNIFSRMKRDLLHSRPADMTPVGRSRS